MKCLFVNRPQNKREKKDLFRRKKNKLVCVLLSYMLVLVVLPIFCNEIPVDHDQFMKVKNYFFWHSLLSHLKY